MYLHKRSQYLTWWTDEYSGTPCIHLMSPEDDVFAEGFQWRKIRPCEINSIGLIQCAGAYEMVVFAAAAAAV